MPYHGPGHEHVHLTAYERHQIELIEQALASEDPRRPRDVRTGIGNMWWIALMIVGGWAAVFGAVAGAVLLIVLGSVGTSGAVAMYWRGRRRRDR